MIESSSYFVQPGPLPKVDEAVLELIHESEGGHCLLLKGHRNDRVVVYKALRSQFRDDPVYQRMLRREYEIARSLKHPGVCEVLGWITLPGYGDSIEMEWVDGCSLGEWLARNGSDVKLTRRVLIDISDALAYIHRKQVIHKDLKPENILVTRFGDHVKIIDFGLSDTDSILTGKDPAGTFNYAAPEVLAGGVADERSDIYSLGKIIGQAGPAFSRIARRCTVADPARRPSSAELVAASLADGSKAEALKWVAFAAIAVIALATWLYLRDKGSAGQLFMDAVQQVRQSATISL